MTTNDDLTLGDGEQCSVRTAGKPQGLLVIFSHHLCGASGL